MSIKAKYLFVASMDVTPEKEALFNEVYDTEHVPTLLKVPGVVNPAAFNLLGPLTNPAGATRQLVGVPRADLTELVTSPRTHRLLLQIALLTIVPVVLHQSVWLTQPAPATETAQALRIGAEPANDRGIRTRLGAKLEGRALVQTLHAVEIGAVGGGEGNGGQDGDCEKQDSAEWRGGHCGHGEGL